MFIYCITNIKNNKKYIGQTIRPLKERWEQHYTTINFLNTKFSRAIKKYGKENFIIEILEVCDNKTCLDEREKYWIEKLNTYNFGYNSTLGGQGGMGHKKSKKCREQLSQKKKGRKFSKEHREKLSKSHKGQIPWSHGLSGKDNPLYGRSRTESIKLKISLTKRKKSIDQFDLNGNYIKSFRSIKDACEELKCAGQNITACCKKRRKSAYGFIWSYKGEITCTD